MDVVTKSGEVVNISEKQVYTFPNGLLNIFPALLNVA